MAIVLMSASPCAGGEHISTVVGRSLRSVSDGAMTSASANLDSATAAWATADVGRTVCVLGAGVNGIPLVARITSRVSATRVTLEQAATMTVTGRVVHVVQTASLRPFEVDNSMTRDPVTEEEIYVSLLAWGKLNRERGATMVQARGQVILADVPLS